MATGLLYRSKFIRSVSRKPPARFPVAHKPPQLQPSLSHFELSHHADKSDRRLLPRNRYPTAVPSCLLSGEKPTSRSRPPTSEFDPKQTIEADKRHRGG